MRYFKVREAIDDVTEALYDVRLASNDYQKQPDLVALATALTTLMQVVECDRGLTEAMRFETFCLHGLPVDDDGYAWDDDTEEDWSQYPGHGAG